MAEKEGRIRLPRLTEAVPFVLANVPHIEINGSNELVAEGCMGVLLCEEERIKLSLGRQTLTVTGTGLTISGMSGRSVYIKGRFVSLEFM